MQPYRVTEVDRQARRLQRKQQRHNGDARQARLSAKRRREDNLSDIVDTTKDLLLWGACMFGLYWFFSLFVR